MNLKLNGMDACLCCEFFDAWLYEKKVCKVVSTMIKHGKEMYERNQREFDGMICQDVENIACKLFQNNINYGRILAFLVFAVVQFPDEKTKTCNALRTIDKGWWLYFDNFLFY